MKRKMPASKGRSLPNQARYHTLEREIKDKLGRVVTLYKRFDKLRSIQKTGQHRSVQVLASKTNCTRKLLLLLEVVR
jgi:hypothetical protein